MQKTRGILTIYLLTLFALFIPAASAYLQTNGAYQNFYTLDAGGGQYNDSVYHSETATGQLANHNMTSQGLLDQEGIYYAIFAHTLSLAYQIVLSLSLLGAFFYLAYVSDSVNKKHWPIKLLIQYAAFYMLISTLAFVMLLATGQSLSILSNQYSTMIITGIGFSAYLLIYLTYQKLTNQKPSD
jgi:hypothetical protein